MARASGNRQTSQFDRANVRGQAVSLMRGLIMMCSTLKPLPANRMLDIQVEYYDDITPQAYTPTHFQQPTLAPPPKAHPAKKSLVINIGSFETPFHNLNLKILCEQRKVDESLLSQVGAVECCAFTRMHAHCDRCGD